LIVVVEFQTKLRISAYYLIWFMVSQVHRRISDRATVKPKRGS